jgi:signal transduction histidine kinase
VVNTGQLLLRLANDMLKISMIEAGKLALDVEELDPRGVLDYTLPLVALQATSKSLRLVAHALFPRMCRRYWNRSPRERSILCF